jgi:hypothetical protein
MHFQSVPLRSEVLHRGLPNAASWPNPIQNRTSLQNIASIVSGVKSKRLQMVKKRYIGDPAGKTFDRMRESSRSKVWRDPRSRVTVHLLP